MQNHIYEDFENQDKLIDLKVTEHDICKIYGDHKNLLIINHIKGFLFSKWSFRDIKNSYLAVITKHISADNQQETRLHLLNPYLKITGLYQLVLHYQFLHHDRVWPMTTCIFKICKKNNFLCTQKYKDENCKLISSKTRETLNQDVPSLKYWSLYSYHTKETPIQKIKFINNELYSQKSPTMPAHLIKEI